MHLYEINPVDRLPLHVIARSAQEAVDLFATWSAACGRPQQTFNISKLPVENLNADQQVQVRRAFAAGLIGVCHFDKEIGWTFSPPLWTPLSPDEADPGADDEASPVMRIYQMRDSTPIEAFALAPNYDRARELFRKHLLAHGGDPDTLLWRQVELQDLDQPANDAVYEALDFSCEGLVICDAAGQWSFTNPLGCHRY